MRALGQAIAADRQRLGLSQDELARHVGVTQQAIAKWEKGSASPRGKRLSRLSSALGKKSHTSAVIDAMLTPHTTVGDGHNMDVPQERALLMLAKAAQDIAQAAQTLAEAVAKLTDTPPKREHSQH